MERPPSDTRPEPPPADVPVSDGNRAAGPSLGGTVTIKRLAGVLAGLIAVTTGAVALLFQLLPGLKPQGPPQTLSANITKVTVDPDVRLREFGRRFDIAALLGDRILDDLLLGNYRRQDAEILKEQTLNLPGAVVYVQIRVEGFRRKLRSPGAFLYDAKTRARIEGPYHALIEFANRLEPSFRPRAANDQGVAAIFIVCPERGRAAYLRIELRDDENRLVDVADSRPFTCTLRYG
jgi:hypothetical protein